MSWSSSSSSSLVLSSLLFLLSVQSQQYEGDNCNLGDGTPGKCLLLDKCPRAYADLLAGKPPGKLCGFSSFDPIVCCQIAETSRPTTVQTITEKSVDDNRGKIARRKCAEYAKSVYALVIPPVLAGNRKPVNTSLCAVTSRKLIVGGKKSDPKEFPHMAAIGYVLSQTEVGWYCGGTLVSENFVMTAAHCTYSNQWGNATWVRVGDLNLATSNDEARPQDRRIVQRIRHPDYKKPSQYHDIALLKLERPVEFNAWVRPACLHTSSVIEDGKAVATGWGRVNWIEDTGSNDLLKVTLSLVPQPSCNASFSFGTVDSKLRYGIVDDWQICAGELGKDTCQGDSGGPLAIFDKDQYCMYTVVGITSLGRLCGSTIPGVYTRVYHYVSWLESIIWPLG